ncbi:MAG TPA: transporter associated domain-containing protein [Halothiobacillus sp.]|nr:MAG: magnesium/cobalt efflux protein [Halothiobacillus sp. 20-54-6]HQT43852.1 transporter associated domain-containing protein [Halothiobacillus sp.]
MDDDSSPSRSTESGWFGRLRQQWCVNQIKSCDDILTVVKAAAEKEIIPTSALNLIDSVLEFHDSRVRDVMIPRGQMDVLDITATLPEILAEIAETGHSRYPVILENRDEVAGVLLAKELLHFYASDPAPEAFATFDLRSHMRSVMFVPESKRLDALLAEFRLTRTHMAIVLDEFGGVAGLVTIEDVLEEIVGDIDDEYDTEARVHIREQAPNRFTVRALTPIDEFNDHFSTDFPDDEYDTIGGLITHELGHLPRRGEVVRLGGYEFKILGADKRRLHLLLVTTLTAAQLEAGEPTDHD